MFTSPQWQKMVGFITRLIPMIKHQQKMIYYVTNQGFDKLFVRICSTWNTPLIQPRLLLSAHLDEANGQATSVQSEPAAVSLGSYQAPGSWAILGNLHHWNVKLKQPIKTSTYDTISNNCHVTVKQPPVMATQIRKAITAYSCSRSRGRYPANATKQNKCMGKHICLLHGRKIQWNLVLSIYNTFAEQI